MKHLALALAFLALLAAPASAQIISYASPLPTAAGGTGTTGGGINGSAVVRSGDTIGFSSSATDATVACDVCLIRDAAADTLALQRSSNAETFRVYLGTTDYLSVGGGITGNALVATTLGSLFLRAATGSSIVVRTAAGTTDLYYFNTGGITTGSTDNTEALGSATARFSAAYIGTTGIVTNGPIKFANNNSTAAVLGAVGTTCPAVTCTAAYTWEKGVSSDGSVVYFPLWK